MTLTNLLMLCLPGSLATSALDVSPSFDSVCKVYHGSNPHGINKQSAELCSKQSHYQYL
jgi:hypothetical protein